MGALKNKAGEPREKQRVLLFPELRDLNPKMPFSMEMAKGNHESELILIHHLNELAVPFAESVSSGYNIRQIVGISYSASNSVANELSKSFKVTVPDSFTNIKTIVKDEVTSSKRSVIIEEIGGYTAEISAFLDERQDVLGVAEDTNQGHWAWERTKLKRLPVMSVAQSRLKKTENSFVGKAIIEASARFLEETGAKKLSDSTILVSGYGNIGREVAKYIEPLCANLFVFDTDVKKQQEASEHFSVSRSLSEADIVIGTTGSREHSVKPEDIKMMKSGVILLSGSSQRVEFDLEGFSKVASSFERNKDFFTYYVDGKKIQVANAGEPMNFRYEALMPSRVIDLVFGSLMYCVDLMDKRLVQPGLNELSEKQQDNLMVKYLSTYHAKTLDELLRRQ